MGPVRRTISLILALALITAGFGFLVYYYVYHRILPGTLPEELRRELRRERRRASSPRD